MDFLLKKRWLVRNHVVYILILSFSIFWCFLFISAPFFRSGGSFLRRVSILSTLFFAPVCHQMAERSFCIMGYPVAVCARCSGIYVGFLLGTLIYPFIRKLESDVLPERWILGIGITPMILEVCLSRLGMIGTHRYLMGLSGLILGSVIAFFVIPSVFQLVRIINKREVNDYGRKTG